MSKQAEVAAFYRARGYTTDLVVLGLGLNEEAGEVSAAILDRLPQFQPKPGRIPSDLAHELNDCLTYLCAIANAAGIDLGI